MRQVFLASLGSLIACAGLVMAQAAPDQPVARPPAAGTAANAPPVPWAASAPLLVLGDNGCPGGNPACPCPEESAPCTRFWGRGEYLLWWVKDGPLPLPLVTTGNPSIGHLAGTIGQPSTVVLYGGSALDYGTFSGMRYTFGGWLDDDRIVGLEASAFLLERRSTSFAARSDNAGNPPLYVPAFNVGLGREDSLVVADPTLQFGGGVAVITTTRLWGTEANWLLNVLREEAWNVALLAGFRQFDLQEAFRLDNTTTDLALGTVTTLQDRFGTRNQFFGSQLGGHIGFQTESLSVAVTGKVALGQTHEVVAVNGNITQTGPLAPTPGSFTGGFFAQPTNIRRKSHNQFTAIPQVQGKLAYNLGGNVAAFVGYDFLYWDRVVRPGNQIDRNLNLSQSPVFGAGALTGPPVPARLFNRSDFWAHGITFGLEARF
jgi:hypothetical protein